MATKTNGVPLVKMGPGKRRDNRKWKHIGEQETSTEMPKKPRVYFWQKHGFKRATGTALATTGGTLIATGNILWGGILLGVGTFIGAIGLVHGAIKKEAGVDQSNNIGKAISNWLIATYNLIKCLTKKGV